MKYRHLDRTEFKSFVDRFERFRDAFVVKLELFCTHLHPQGILTIDALDKELGRAPYDPGGHEPRSSNQFLDLSRIVVILRDIREFYWPTKWHGCFDFDSIQITEHAGSVLFAIRSYDEEDVLPKSLNYLIDMPESRPFFYCRSIEYEVIHPHPHTPLWNQIGISSLNREGRIKHNAPVEYNPGSQVSVVMKRVVEAGDPSEMPSGAIYATVKYPDGSFLEVPDEWLEEVT
ncbi:MAG: hypothetical protein WCB27_18750 [Thermoguttaceae bacterium]|jgi:hypothetical protein